jgi:hypothetical protein
MQYQNGNAQMGHPQANPNNFFNLQGIMQDVQILLNGL